MKLKLNLIYEICDYMKFHDVKKYSNNKLLLNYTLCRQNESEFPSKNSKNLKYKFCINYEENTENMLQLNHLYHLNQNVFNFQFIKKFCVFKTFRGKHLCIFVYQNVNLIVYNLEKKNLEKIIFRDNDDFYNFLFIISVQHFFNSLTNRDWIIITTKSDLNILYIRDVENNFDIIFAVCNSSNIIFSFCLYVDDFLQNVYLCLSSYSEGKIKIWDIKENKLFQEIKDDSNLKYNNYLCFYNSNFTKQNYIIACNNKQINSFTLSKGKIYKTYFGKPQSNHFYSVVYPISSGKEYLLESDDLGCIRIWDFHKAVLIVKIPTPSMFIYNFCVWNDYIIIGSTNKSILVYEIKNGNYIASIKTNRNIYHLDKLFLPKLGACLFAICDNGEIKCFN